MGKIINTNLIVLWRLLRNLFYYERSGAFSVRADVSSRWGITHKRAHQWGPITQNGAFALSVFGCRQPTNAIAAKSSRSWIKSLTTQVGVRYLYASRVITYYKTTIYELFFPSVCVFRGWLWRSINKAGPHVRKLTHWEDMLMSYLCNWESGGPQAGRRLAYCSSRAKCSTEGGVRWGSCDEKSDPSCVLEKKRSRIDLTKKEDHTGLRKIYLDRSGPKLNKIQAQLQSPTPASSTPEISIVAPQRMWRSYLQQSCCALAWFLWVCQVVQTK